MPSERRLHPLSILFGIGSSLRELALPFIIVLVTAGTAGLDWEAWAILAIVPYTGFLIARYLTFRYRYEAGEIVIRSGLIFRNERHVPYDRIQNLDAVENVLHRLAGVVEVRLETGAGAEPEATMRVLSRSAFEEMRRRVAEARGTAQPAAAGAVEEPAPRDRVVHALGVRELMLVGLIDNRGMIVVAAAFGLLWEFGLFERVLDGVLGDRQLRIRDIAAAAFDPDWRPMARIVGLLGVVLIVIRLLSMAWAVVRLHGFVLTREREDLRLAFGLFTRVTATIPLRRIQTVTLREGVLHRWTRRLAVRVSTAGGPLQQEASVAQRQWLAPIIRREALPALLREVLPGVDVEGAGWQPVHPRAFGRALRERLVVAAVLAGALAFGSWRWAAGVGVLLLVWAVVDARQYVRHLGWAVTGGAVLFRSGWLRRHVTIARFARIQVVDVQESPFDRRRRMARVRVDTAGSSSHPVDIPYLARDTAWEIWGRLAAEASRTTFRW